MNFLAHALVAGLDDHAFFIGNLMADFVRGRVESCGYPPRVREGIRLHRHVDSFTDTHPVFIRSRDRIKPVWGRYSPILIDMFYDHFLAVDWNTYHNESLAKFSSKAYRILNDNKHRLPDRMLRAVDHMIEHDWFNSYAEIEGIGLALSRMSKRIPARREIHLGESINQLREHYQELQADFNEFMPQLIVEARRRK